MSMTFEETTRANDSPTKDIVAMVLLAIAAIGGVVAIFFLPFAFGPVALLLAIVAITISVKHRGLGLLVMGGVTFCWLLGAAIAVWNSNAIY
jgi:hypothetical protein